MDRQFFRPVPRSRMGSKPVPPASAPTPSENGQTNTPQPNTSSNPVSPASAPVSSGNSLPKGPWRGIKLKKHKEDAIQNAQESENNQEDGVLNDSLEEKSILPPTQSPSTATDVVPNLEKAENSMLSLPQNPNITTDCGASKRPREECFCRQCCFGFKHLDKTIFQKASDWPFMYDEDHILSTIENIQDQVLSRPQYRNIRGKAHGKYYARRWQWDALFPTMDDRPKFPGTLPKKKINPTTDMYDDVFAEIFEKAVAEPYRYDRGFIEDKCNKLRAKCHGHIWWGGCKQLWCLLFPDEKEIFPKHRRKAKLDQVHYMKDLQVNLAFDTENFIGQEIMRKATSPEYNYEGAHILNELEEQIELCKLLRNKHQRGYESKKYDQHYYRTRSWLWRWFFPGEEAAFPGLLRSPNEVSRAPKYEAWRKSQLKEKEESK